MIIHELSEMIILEELGMIIGFFTGVKPPKITDAKKHNKAVALLWFITGIVFELIGLPFLFLKQNSSAFVFMMLATVALVIVMMVVYLSISRKYEEK